MPNFGLVSRSTRSVLLNHGGRTDDYLFDRDIDESESDDGSEFSWIYEE